MARIISVLLTVFISANIYSQTDSSYNKLFSMSLEQLLELKISSVSKKSEDLLKTPQTVIVITEEQIKRRGYTDLEQLFHDLPGFDISRGNGTAYSQIYQRGYRTKNTEKTVLLIDGVEENDLWSNNIWLSRQYPLSNIKRVEIIYGPAATIYGANAFLGVINIVTKDAEDIIKEGKKFGINSQTAYGSWNTKYTDITLSGRTEKISLILTGRLFVSDEPDLSSYPDWDYNLDNYDIDYYKRILCTVNDTIAETAMISDKNAYYKSAELNGLLPEYSNKTEDYLFYGKLKIDNFTLGFQSFKRNEGFGAWYRDDFELGTDFGAKWVPLNSFFYTKYEKKLSENLSVTSFSNFKVHQLTGDCEELYFKGYFNKELKLTDIADTTGGNTYILPSDSISTPYWEHTWWNTYSQQLRSEFRADYKISEKLNIISGAEFRISHIQGEYLFGEQENPEETAYINNAKGGNHYAGRDLGLFTQIGYSPLKNLNFVLGGRLDNNKIRLSGGYGTVFNPKAAVIYSFTGATLKAIYSEAFMDAGYWTKYGTTPGRLLDNPNLKPEEVKNFEVSAGRKINDFMFVDISAYHSFYKGAVGTVNVSFVDEQGDTIYTTQHRAIGNLSIKGIQSNFYFNYRNYSAYINYTYTNPYNTTNEKIRIGDIASNRLNFGLNALFFSKLNINIRGNYVGERPTGTNTTVSGNPLNKIDPYFVLNGAISYNIYKGASLQFTANNILDKEYFDPGVRSADGIYYAAKMPQNRRNFLLKMYLYF